MTKFQFLYLRSLVFAIALLLVTTPTIADKHNQTQDGKYKHRPNQEWKHGKPADHNRSDAKHKSSRPKPKSPYLTDRYFNDQHRIVFQQYYVNQYRSGRCPPGLKKKNNGCQPPGQAKRWSIGRPLARDVIFYAIPASITRQIGYPPAGYRFVRVASDILMITIGSGLVVDAISDLYSMQ